MKSTCVAILAASLFLVSIASAETNFDQKKADQLKRIDERIAHLQEERTCIQLAANHETLKSCHDKFRNEVKADKANRKKL